jgi:tetratricopeptide (TPR) repeat protein
METLYNYYVSSNRLVQAKKVAEAEALECPSEPEYFERAANVCGKLNDLELAAFYFRKAFALSPSFERARILFVLYLDLDRPVDALPYIDHAISFGKDPRLGIVKLNTEEIIRLEQALGKDTLNTVLLDRIAHEYYSMGNRAGALKCLEIRGRSSHGQ